METFRFVADLRCFLANGKRDVLRNFAIAVEADSPDEARDNVRSVAIEMVHDQGSRLLDAPLDRLEIVRISEAT
jgi:hypothetical protein